MASYFCSRRARPELRSLLLRRLSSHRRELQGWSQQLQGPRWPSSQAQHALKWLVSDWWVTGVSQQCDLIPKDCVKSVWQWQFGHLFHLQTQTFSGYDQQGHQRRGVTVFKPSIRWGKMTETIGCFHRTWGNLWIFEIPFFLWESWESWWSLGKQPSCQVGTSTNTFRCIAQCRSTGSAALHCREHHLLHRAQRAKYTQLQPLQERMDGIDGIESKQSKQSKCDEHWWTVLTFSDSTTIQLRFNLINIDSTMHGVLENSRWKCWVAEKKNGRNSWWKQIGVAVVSPRINPKIAVKSVNGLHQHQ